MSEWDDVRHGATVHLVAQLAVIGAAQACQALVKRGLMDKEDLQPIHLAWQSMDKEMEHELPGEYRQILYDAISRFPRP